MLTQLLSTMIRLLKSQLIIIFNLYESLILNVSEWQIMLIINKWRTIILIKLNMKVHRMEIIQLIECIMFLHQLINIHIKFVILKP